MYTYKNHNPTGEHGEQVGKTQIIFSSFPDPLESLTHLEQAQNENTLFPTLLHYLQKHNISSLCVVEGGREKWGAFSQFLHSLPTLPDSPIEYHSFQNFSSNPTKKEVLTGLEFFTHHHCHGLLAVGGGSALDVGKGILYFLQEQHQKVHQEFRENQKFLKHQKHQKHQKYQKHQKHPQEKTTIPFFALPTTAGTGSESTEFAVVYVAENTPDPLGNPENLESFENLENIKNLGNLENIKNLGNLENTKNLGNFENTKNLGNLENQENLKILENLESTKNFENLESTKNLESLENFEILENLESIKNFENLENQENQKNFKTLENLVPQNPKPMTVGIKEKQSLQHPNLLPDYAFLEPRFLLSLPLYQRKCTFLDALCQGLESYWAKGSTETSRLFASKGIHLLWEALAETTEEMKSEPTEEMKSEPTEEIKGEITEETKGEIPLFFTNHLPSLAKVQWGANLCGRAIQISKTTAPHAMSYGITSLCHLPHGHAVALCFVEVWHSLGKVGEIEEAEVVGTVEEVGEIEEAEVVEKMGKVGEVGEENKKHPKENPSTYGNPNPSTCGDPNPSTCGNPNPSTYGDPNPSTCGNPNPSTYGDPNPSTCGNSDSVPLGQRKKELLSLLDCNSWSEGEQFFRELLSRWGLSAPPLGATPEEKERRLQDLSRSVNLQRLGNHPISYHQEDLYCFYQNVFREENKNIF